MSQQTTLVIGEGEIGLPIAEILSSVYNVITKDIDPIPDPGEISVLHICYPFEIVDFVETTIRYIKNYAPEITMVHSTVVPGTTKQISEQVSSPVIYSPVRGKHSKMTEELLSLRILSPFASVSNIFSGQQRFHFKKNSPQLLIILQLLLIHPPETI